MVNFFLGVLASFLATFLFEGGRRWAWPTFKDRCLYSGVRVDGAWDITEERHGQQVKCGKLVLSQTGATVTGTSVRLRTRDGKESERTFAYHGTIRGNQVTLTFEDRKGIGFDSGTYVFTVQNDAKTMVGMATFHGKSENRIVSEMRILTKAVA